MAVFIARELLLQKAIRLTFIAPWTWAEFEKVRDKVEAYLDKVGQEVDLIIDLRQAGEAIPRDAFARLARSYAASKANLRQHIIVGAPQWLQELFHVADRYYTALGGLTHFVFVHDMQEAHQHIQSESD
jgi:hypothetical protein